MEGDDGVIHIDNRVIDNLLTWYGPYGHVLQRIGMALISAVQMSVVRLSEGGKENLDCMDTLRKLAVTTDAIVNRNGVVKFMNSSSSIFF